MRNLPLVLSLCAMMACDESSETPPVETAPSVESPTQPVPTVAAVETTTGFIEATIDGEHKRYEYLLANENRVMTRITMLDARAGADDEEGIKISLTGWDVRTLELPRVFKRDVGAAARGDIAALQRIATFGYKDAEGTSYTILFDDDSLECQSLERLLLKCTFSGTAQTRGGGTVEITDGRAEIQLVTDEMADAFTESTVGAAADESTERVQEAIDRLRNKRKRN